MFQTIGAPRTETRRPHPRMLAQIAKHTGLRPEDL